MKVKVRNFLRKIIKSTMKRKSIPATKLKKNSKFQNKIWRMDSRLWETEELFREVQENKLLLKMEENILEISIEMRIILK